MKLSNYFDVSQIIGDAEILATHYSNSNIKGTVTFAETEYFLKQALNNAFVVAVITKPELMEGVATNKAVVISKTPKKDFFNFHNFMYEQGCFNLVTETMISPEAVIAPTAVIKSNVIIEDNVVIDDYVVVESNSILKQGVYVGAYSIIGARGMHNTFVDDERVWVNDAGGVVLEQDVQVLSSATVQKSYFFEATKVGKRSIVSVQCNIGHGAVVGAETMIAGNAQLAGYVQVGNQVWVGPSVTVAHGLKIGDGAEILIGSTVINDISPGQKVSGNFAMNHLKNIRKFTRDSK
jgi:UDP-3-O-[3-hydroxymyristoyl] glucosamine N-acyltransferase